MLIESDVTRELHVCTSSSTFELSLKDNYYDSGILRSLSGHLLSAERRESLSLRDKAMRARMISS